MGAKNEIHFLEKSATKGRELLGAFWDNRSAEFLQVQTHGLQLLRGGWVVGGGGCALY
jgi:hypothetical protein